MCVEELLDQQALCKERYITDDHLRSLEVGVVIEVSLLTRRQVRILLFTYYTHKQSLNSL